MVLGAFGGRMDQVMANINTLYEATKIMQTKIVLLSEDQLAFLLMKV